MKIAIIHPSFSCRGGAERKALLLAQGLGKTNAVEIITHAIDKEKTFSELLRGISFKVFPQGSNLFSRMLSLPKTAKKLQNYDIYNPHNFPAHFIAALAKRRYKKPIVWFCNEPLLYMEGTVRRENPLFLRIYRLLEKWVVRQVDVVVANSQNTAKNIEKHLGVKPVVIYSGIDTKIYVPKKVKRKNQLFFVSRIEREKNVEFLLEVIRSINKKLPSTKLIIAGDGPHFSALKKQAVGMKSIVFLGNTSEQKKISMYQESMVVVYPPKNEPLGVIPLEAMACQTPVVAFNSGGCKETIVHGKTGFLADNEEEFILHTLHLLKNSNLIKQLGTQGRMRIVQNFSVEQMVTKTQKVMEDVCK